MAAGGSSASSAGRDEPTADHTLERRYTIAELALASESTERRIRYYQSEGLLEPPRLVGRTGFYGLDHLQRLRFIASLRDRGLKLAAIREIVAAEPLDPSTAMRSWLSAVDAMEPWTDELRPQTLTRAEVEAKVAGMADDFIERLEATPLISRVPDSDPPRYVTPAIDILDLTVDLERNVSVPIEVTIAAGDILARHLEPMAAELVAFFIGQVEQVADQPIDLTAAYESLRSVASRGVLLWFNIGMDEAVRAALAGELADGEGRGATGV